MLQGDAIAKDFLIPQYEGYNKPSHTGDQFEHIQPYDDGLKAETGLQDVQGQTADYYRKVANLKSFMHDVHTNYGIDVRVPDAAKGEMAIKLNELYNHALADIMNQGNKLKTSHERNNLLVSQRAQFFNDPRLKPTVEQQQGVDYTFNDVHPLVKEANDGIKAAYDAGDYKAQEQLYKDRKEYFEKLKIQHPMLEQEYDRQIAALDKPRKGVFRPQAQNWQERLYGHQTQTAGAFVKDIAHIVNMARNFEVDPNTGKLVNNEYTGTIVGQTSDGKPITIKDWEGNPETKTVDLVLSNGQRISGKGDIATIIRMIARAKGQDKGFGMDHLEQYLIDNNFNDTNTQEVNTQRMMESSGGIDKTTKKPTWLLKQEENIKAAKDYEEAKVEPAKKSLHEELVDFAGPTTGLPDWLGGAGQVKNLGGYQIQNNGKKGYNIINLAEKIPNFKTKSASQQFYANYHHFDSIEALEQFLTDHGVHMSEFNKKAKGGTNVAPNKVQAADNDPLGILK